MSATRLPLSTEHLHGWKGIVFVRELYTLLIPTIFRVPIDLGLVTVSVCPIVVAGQASDPSPLTRMEQAMINRMFTHHKNYFMSIWNIKHTCFTTLDASINDALKVLADPAIQGWHAKMCVIDILNQLLA